MHALNFSSSDVFSFTNAIANNLKIMPVESTLNSNFTQPAATHSSLIGPGDLCMIHRNDTRSNKDRRNASEAALFGLIPSWACDSRSAKNNCLVHTATVSNKPVYRTAVINAQFCWVMASYFLGSVWKDGREHSVRIERADQQPFYLAGIWSEWSPNKATSLLSFCLLTRDNDSQLKSHGVRIGQSTSQCFAFLSPTDLRNWLDQPFPQAMEQLANTNYPDLRVTPYISSLRSSYAS